MPDIVSQRQTHILVANDDALYPAEHVFPSDTLFPKDAGLLDIENIVMGSLKLNEKISDKIPQFGQMYASKFECKVYLTDDLKGKFIQVYQLNGDVYRAVFTGMIDSCKLDKVGTDRTIIAYDFAYTKGQINVAEWWTEFWRTRETATLKQARDSMLDWAEIVYEDVSLPNDSITITKTVDITTCTLTTMLRMMCELSYCFPHFDRNGELQFIFLNTDPEETVDLTDRYEWTKSSFEDFTTTDIDGVQFYDSGNQLKWTVGETTNAYPIKKNIFLYEKGTELLNQVGNEILDYLKDLVYTPSKVKMIVSDWDLHLGDWVHTEKGDFYVLSNTYSGSQFFEQTVEAKGQELLYGGTPHINYGELVLDERIARVNYTIEQFQIEYGNFKEQTNSKFTQTDTVISTEVSRATSAENTIASNLSDEVTRATGAESSLSSRITQTADAITAEVTRATNKETDLADDISAETTRATGVESTLSSRITQTADAITAEVTRATAAEGTLDSKITQTAESISLEVTNGSDSSTIKLKLGQAELSSKVIQMTGLVKFTDLSTSGNTTINGSNITTGTIDATKVTVTNLNADNITSGTISADKIKGGQLTIDPENSWTTAIVVKKNNTEYITMNTGGITINNIAGSNSLKLSSDGFSIGWGSSLNGISLTGNNSGGEIIVGGQPTNRTTISNGSVTIAGSSSSLHNALTVSSGKTSVQALSCSSLAIGANTYSEKTIYGLIAGTNSAPGITEIKQTKLKTTTLWAVNAYSSPSMQSLSGGGYGFRSQPSWTKIELDESSYSTKIYGLTGSYSQSPSITTTTVLGR